VWIFLSQALIIFSPLFLFSSLIVAHRARTLFPEIGEIIMARMAVRPSDVDAGPRGHVHLYTGGLPSFIDRYRHRMAFCVTFRISVVLVEPAFRRAL